MNSSVKNKLSIMEVIYAFDLGGSEQLSATIARKLHDRGYPISVCSLSGSDGPIRKQLEEVGIRCFSVGMGRVSRLRFLYELYKIFRREKPDVVHIHHVPLFIQAYLPARLAGIKRIVLTEHSNHLTINESRLKKLSRFFSKRADVVTTIHDGLREFFINDLGVSANKVIAVPNGVDVNKFSPRQVDEGKSEVAGLDPDKFVISCVGRLVPEKDHENLLNAIKRLVDSGMTDFEVVIVGDGPRFDEVQRIIEKLGISPYVKMLGARNDVVDILKGTDVVVLSSKTEGLPMVLIEAMAAGVPCVATAVGGIPQLLSDGAGVVVPAKDSESLAGAIKDLYENRDRLKEIGPRARQRIVEGYDIDHVVDCYLSVFGNETSKSTPHG
jgi:glycosyltransferase involved in cell wall biosynthesis